MHIKTELPTYLEGLNYNIPLRKNWNSSLIAGLEAISKEIINKHLTTDIDSINIERIDEMGEFKAQGIIGYSVPTRGNKLVDRYYYVDFVLSKKDTEDKYWYEKGQYYQYLNDKLNEYIDSVTDYTLEYCKFDTKFDDNEGMVLVMRAYFIGIPSRSDQ